MVEDSIPWRADKNRLRDIIRLTADLVWETDRDHRLILLSDNSQDLLGHHSSTLLGRHLGDIWQFENSSDRNFSLDWRQPFRDVKAIYQSKSNEYQHFLLSGLPVFNDVDGSFICVRGIAKNVDDAVRKAEEQRVLQERTSAIIGFASTGISVADENSVIVECNEAWLQFFGSRRNEMLGMSLREMTYHEDEAESVRNIENLFAGKIGRYRQEKRYIRFDGSIAWADVSVSGLRAPDGTVTHSIAGLNDITDRKLAEFALQTSRQKLSEQRALLQTTLDSIDQGFAVWDADDCLVAWNHTLGEMWYRPANLLLMQRIVDRIDGVTLRSATDAEQGIEIAAKENPDLVIMDISLPGMDGFEALKCLKSDPETVHLPVIAISANALPAQVARGNEAGFSGYLTKPIDILEVTAMLKSFLSEH